ncbi:hypothetical protein ASPWEDRAFT_169940 [Aspergillus wentii DTO 134E9]|uniref:Clr5 domain-containing protein n=1 Tax=Aspergillus wentii DTO 134E9 TaxID=1073089 RepID=A0A1L9RNK4_ASPWE|nr:uncharacterized protein ASPWEDRAFT_169940 [Aspergillus wentii DTO 134E9]KAI9926074.1 hypothetical protein MW887_004535 [Aspergillus wentii]OJJ36417.1 hypothetical protein ASPWEDRAFT_169940 [Aspergillus wentii DTO 134E9]
MADSTWQAHKAEIEQLYIKDGKTLHEVKRKLESMRGFRRSKKQYERAFTKWGFKKYKMNPQRWKYINVKLQKRKRQSDVFVYGERYLPERIRKGISRHGHVSTVELYSAPSPETPEGIVVCTPEPSGNVILEWPRELPWQQFLRITGSQSRPEYVPSVSTAGQFALHSNDMQIPKSYLIGEMESILPWADNRSGIQIAKCLTVLMPEEYEGQHYVSSEVLLRSDHLIGQQECQKMFLYLLSNNILDFRNKIMMRLFQGFGLDAREGTRELLFISSITASVAAERLFGRALKTGDLNTVEMLLKAGMDPHTPMLDDSLRPLTPLEYVAFSDRHARSVSHQMTRLLLSYHAQPNKHLGKHSALQRATSSKDKRLMDILLSRGAAISSHTLKAAAETSDASVVRILVDAALTVNQRIQFNDENWGAMLGKAVHESNLEMARSFLSWGADVNALQPLRGARDERQTTVLGIAAYAGDIPMLELLLANGAVVNPELPGGSSSSPLGLAVDEGRAEAVRILLSRGGDVNASHSVPFGGKDIQTNIMGLAAARGHVSILELLLDADSVVNPHFVDGNLHAYPLVIAVYYGHESATRFLLDAGADPDIPIEIWTSNGIRRPLGSLFECSLFKGQLNVCRDFLNAGAAVTGLALQDYYSASLQKFIHQQDFESSIQLLQLDIHLNHAYGAFGRSPSTPLGAAIEVGNIEMINTLRRAGATDLGLALYRIGNMETAEYLASAGALNSIMLSVGDHIILNAISAKDKQLACYLLDWALEQQSRVIIDIMFRPRSTHPGPLEVAINTQQLGLAKTLVAHGAPVTNGALEWCDKTIANTCLRYISCPFRRQNHDPSPILRFPSR